MLAICYSENSLAIAIPNAIDESINAKSAVYISIPRYSLYLFFI